MKKIFAFIFIYFTHSFSGIAQSDKSLIQIIRLDQVIYTWDKTGIWDSTGNRNLPSYSKDTVFMNKNNQNGDLKKEHYSLAVFVRDSLLPHFDIASDKYDPVRFNAGLDRITHVETITWFEFVFEDVIAKSEDNLQLTIYNPSQLNEMHHLIEKRIDEIMDKEISLYRFTATSKKPVKALYVDHSNDFLSFYNDDRDMTGAFRLEIATDLFKMRILSGYSDRWYNLNSRNYYSYQTVFVGGEGYTPYLRDTSIFKSDTAFDVNDRPYASFKYFGRAKHRVSRKGRFRMFNQFKIGSIGSLTPNKIQSVIHRDVTIGSYRPRGWGAQIAAGGRTAFSLEYYPEWMLTSLTKHQWFNISGLAEIKYGTDMTSLGVGLNFCNKGFLKTGGVNLSLAERGVSGNSFGSKLKDYFQKNIVFNYRFLCRYVFHNSMLEGYGITGHAQDEDADSPIDRYYLKSSQVERNVFIHEFTLNFRFRYCGLILKQTYISPEYNLPVNKITYQYGEPGAKSNHNTSPWDHYGTIGLIFKIQ